MHTVEVLEAALDAARRLGFAVREEWLGGSGGGPCEIRGAKCLFVDLAESPAEQLDQAAAAIRSASHWQTLDLPDALRRYLLTPAPQPARRAA